MNLKIKITVVISLVFLVITTLLGYIFFITMDNSLQRDVELEAEKVCQEAAYTVEKNVYTDLYVLRAMMAHSDIVETSYSSKFKIKTVQQIVRMFGYEYILLIWNGEYYWVYEETYEKRLPETSISFPADSESILFGRLYGKEKAGLLIAEPALTNEDGVKYQMVLKRPEEWIYKDLMFSKSLKDRNVVVSTSDGQVLYPDRFENMKTGLPERIPEPTMELFTLDGSKQRQDLYAYSMSLENVPLNITSFVDQEHKAAQLREHVRNYLMLAVCSLVLVAAIVYYLSKHMTGAVTGLARYVENIEHAGNVPEQFTLRKDEAGVLARSFASLMKRLHSTMEEKEYIAFHDKLTGLPNRYVMEQDLAELLETGAKFAFALMDIDNYKAVNDGLGHIEGDRLLIRLADLLRQYDAQELKFYRWGGDEFGVVLYGDTKEAYQRRLDSLLKTAETGFGDFPMKVGVSIGVCLCPQHANTQKAILQCADNALTAVKRHGKNHYSFYGECKEL